MVRRPLGSHPHQRNPLDGRLLVVVEALQEGAEESWETEVKL